MATPQERSQQFLNSLDPDSRSMIYQSIQEFAQLLNADASALVYSKPTEDVKNPWHLIIRVTSGEFQIEAESNGNNFRETLNDLKQKMIDTILEIQSQNESPQDRSKKIEMMSHESSRFTLH